MRAGEYKMLHLRVGDLIGVTYDSRRLLGRPTPRPPNVVNVTWVSEGRAKGVVVAGRVSGPNAAKPLMSLYMVDIDTARGRFEPAIPEHLKADFPIRRGAVSFFGKWPRELEDEIRAHVATLGFRPIPYTEHRKDLDNRVGAYMGLAAAAMGDARLRLEYDPDTHYAACSPDGAIIRRKGPNRNTDTIDNPRGPAIATLDPATGAVQYVHVRNGRIVERAVVDPGRPTPPETAVTSPGDLVGARF